MSSNSTDNSADCSSGAPAFGMSPDDAPAAGTLDPDIPRLTLTLTTTITMTDDDEDEDQEGAEDEEEEEEQNSELGNEQDEEDNNETDRAEEYDEGEDEDEEQDEEEEEEEGKACEEDDVEASFITRTKPQCSKTTLVSCLSSTGSRSTSPSPLSPMMSDDDLFATSSATPSLISCGGSATSSRRSSSGAHTPRVRFKRGCVITEVNLTWAAATYDRVSDVCRLSRKWSSLY